MEQNSSIEVVNQSDILSRQKMLVAIPRMKRCNVAHQSKGISIRSVWMRDVSARDHQSVKAYLAGKGDLRAAWWKLFSGLHRVLAKNNSTKWAMYDFHKMHHVITLVSFNFMLEVKAMKKSILKLGLFEALSVFSTEKSNHKYKLLFGFFNLLCLIHGLF